MRLLVTGFGPYPGVPRNPTALLAAAIAGDPRLRRLGIEARSIVFATRYASIAGALDAALAGGKPDVCLHLGLAPRARDTRVERRGENRCRPLSPDASRQRPPARTLLPKSGAALSTRASPARAVALLRRAGLSARISGDAGAYLCNAVYLLSLAAARETRTNHLALFVHIPRPAPAPGRLPGRRMRRRRPSVALLQRALVCLAVALARDAGTIRRGAPPA